jgi:hypothetical protein
LLEFLGRPKRRHVVIVRFQLLLSHRLRK